MSKKSKTTKKKHQFKHAAPTQSLTTENRVRVDPALKQSEPVLVVAGNRNVTYLADDLRRIATLGIGLFLLQLLLWYSFDHTPLGPMIYRFVDV